MLYITKTIFELIKQWIQQDNHFLKEAYKMELEAWGHIIEKAFLNITL